MLQCLSDRNDPHIAVPFCVGHRNHDAVEYAQRDQTLLAVGRTGVLGGDRGAIEDLVGLSEIDPMLPEIELALGLVPRDHHDKCSYIW